MPVWVRSGPSLAKGPTKRITFREKGHLAKTMLFTMFSFSLGGPWQALGSSRAPLEALLAAKGPLCRHKDTLVQLGSMETVGNERKWMEMDGNGRELSQTRAGSEVKVYLKAKTYD